MSPLKNTRCFVINPYTKSIEAANIQPDTRTLCAILGAKNIEVFQPPSVSYAVLSNADIWNKLTGSIAGTKFKQWKKPVFGIIILIAAKHENSDEYRHAILSEELETIYQDFEKAKVERFKFSS